MYQKGQTYKIWFSPKETQWVNQKKMKTSETTLQLTKAQLQPLQNLSYFSPSVYKYNFTKIWNCINLFPSSSVFGRVHLRKFYQHILQDSLVSNLIKQFSYLFRLKLVFYLSVKEYINQLPHKTKIVWLQNFNIRFQFPELLNSSNVLNI